MWHWLTDRRRAHILENPFPESWMHVLETDVAFWHDLDDDDRARLRALVQVFIAEKTWEGCGGLEITDAMRVTIAAEACQLILGRDHSLFRNVDSILVYPTTVKRPRRPPPTFAVVREPEPLAVGLLGEAHLGGPVLLVWDAARRGARDPHDGRNVVVHEFAHKIDMLDGGADGTPPLESRGAVEHWATVCAEAFLALRRHVESGAHDFLDAYGATNEAEFFAVATESFFERGAAMKQHLPDLYALLVGFYRQDPSARTHRAGTTPR